MEEIQEKTLQREAVTTETDTVPTPFSELDADVKLAIQCAADKKGFDMVVLDLREIASFTEFFVIASGANQRQVQAIADDINEKLKNDLRTKAIRIEGYRSAEWVLLDYGDFIVHIFDKDAREMYDLTRLWGDAKRVALPSNL